MPKINLVAPRILLSFLSSIFVLFATPGIAAYPDHPMQSISPYAAGGANDYLTRLMALQMGNELNANIIVDNKTGANGIVGANYVAKSAPDGYTMLMGNSATHGTNSSLYRSLPYDPLKDFSAVSMVGFVPIVVAVDPRLGIKSIPELIVYGKANPGKLAFGSSGIGGTGHLAGESFAAATQLDIVHVPYKGDALAVTDVAGGQVPLAFVGTASATPMMAAGKIIVLAVAHPNRVSSMPNVPTLTELGLKDIDFSQWYALFVRGGTPKDRINKLNQAAKAALNKDEVKKSMAVQGAEASYSTPEQLDTFFKSEIKRFEKIIQKLNIKPE